ncbi:MULTISPECIES: hypothetical protein [unclassified Streptomyces]|uniref:hypothetical protein n=1 Tax=unclassified Streptomyces TaxID=2593676 RepID=UPI00382B56F0
MRRNREETAPQDPPGGLWHALDRLQHTHPDPVGRVGLLACPAGLLSFTAATGTILTARVQLTSAETMREVNDTLRAMTGDLPHARFTGPGVALKLTLSRRQDLPVHAAHVAGLTRLFRHAAGTIGACSTPGGGRCFHCDGTGRDVPARCGSRLPGRREWHTS